MCRADRHAGPFLRRRSGGQLHVRRRAPAPARTPLVLHFADQPSVPSPRARLRDRRPGRGGGVGTARPPPQRARPSSSSSCRRLPSWPAPGAHPGPPAAVRDRRPPSDASPTGTWPPWAPRPTAGPRLGLGPPPADAASRRRGRASRPTSSRRRSATSPSTPGSGSRWSRSSTRRPVVRPCGGCGGSPGSPRLGGRLEP